MNNILIATAVAGSFLIGSEAALAEGMGLTVTAGIDYTEGEYGIPGADNWTWTYPLIIKYETGPLTLKANFAYVDTRGVNRESGLATSNTTAVEQSGFGDTTLSGFYTLVDPAKSGFGLDLGLKIKLVTADKDKDLITTGNEDYSLQTDLYKGYGAFTAFGTLGWTLKGDIRFKDRSGTALTNPTFGDYFEVSPDNDPWYASVGGSYKLTPETSLGLAYDWRQKLFDSSDDISEATLFVTHKIGRSWKLQGYGLTGFSDASPDWGLGATVGYGF
jgi:hypothetical protein